MSSALVLCLSVLVPDYLNLVESVYLWKRRFVGVKLKIKNKTDQKWLKFVLALQDSLYTTICNCHGDWDTKLGDIPLPPVATIAEMFIDLESTILKKITFYLILSKFVMFIINPWSSILTFFQINWTYWI